MNEDQKTGAGEKVWQGIVHFFIPKMNRWFFLRLGITVVAAWLIFSYLLVPCVISGASMEPTVHSNGFTFCWRGRYWFRQPQRGDIVIIRYDRKIYFLKRIVGMPGETVEFRGGKCYINGRLLEEPYVQFESDWEMSPVTIPQGEYYVVGDNRSMPFAQHQKGVVRAERIAGSPVLIAD